MSHEPPAIDFEPTVNFIVSAVPQGLQQPQIGFICGSGLSGLVEVLRDVVIVPYEKIPGFAKSTGKFQF
jgi:purine-nucleoside phosphorylase